MDFFLDNYKLKFVFMDTNINRTGATAHGQSACTAHPRPREKGRGHHPVRSSFSIYNAWLVTAIN